MKTFKLGALVGLIATIQGCSAAPTDEVHRGPEGEEAVGTLAQGLWSSCTPISADIWDHTAAGRAHDCGFLQYCAQGSEQVIGDFFTLEWKTLSEVNPGYWVLGNCQPPTSFIWPLGGGNWTIQGYFDTAPESGTVRDYAGGQKAYDGHGGVDIAVANFRAQDSGVNVVAAARGVVVDIVDTGDDRSVDIEACQKPGNVQNYVRLRHANGTESGYYHIKKGSARSRISLGQNVAAGTVIAQVGSSGCSSNPHLHFEVREYAGGTFTGPLVDVFRDGTLQSPPPYSNPLALMDVAVIAGAVAGDWQKVLDPGPNATTINRGQAFTMVGYVANGLPGERVKVRVLYPGGDTEWFTGGELTSDGKGTWWRYTWTSVMPTNFPRGEYTVQFVVNGLVRRNLRFTVP